MTTSTADDLLSLLRHHGDEQYDGEEVSQLEHALQCAELAEDAGFGDAVVAAALLHDIGHLLPADDASGLADNEAASAGIDRRHEVVGADLLRGILGDAVATPVRLHVAAKRYLCATETGYFEALSPVSVASLKVQGGVFSEREAMAFAALPYAREAIAVRRYDDLAKVPGVKTRPLSHYAKAVRQFA